MVAILEAGQRQSETVDENKSTERYACAYLSGYARAGRFGMNDRNFLGIPEPRETRSEQLHRMGWVVAAAIVVAIITKGVWILCFNHPISHG